MCEEVGQQVRSSAEPAELPAGLRAQLADVAGQRIEERVLCVPVALLLGIQVRRVPGQERVRVVGRARGEPRLGAARDVRVERVSHEQQRPADAAPEVRQRREQALRADRADEVPSVEPRGLAVEWRGYDDARDLAPLADAA